MNEKRVTVKKSEDNLEKTGFIEWVKEHKVQLLLAGISVTTLFLTILGLKNKDAINELWNSLKKQIEKGSLYSDKWFSKASVEELEAARELVHTDYLNPKLDTDYRNQCWNLMTRFDNAIRKINCQGKEIGFPVHSENGWHLPSDD